MRRGLAILLALGLGLAACTARQTPDSLDGDFQVIAPEDVPSGLQEIGGHAGTEPALFVERTDGGTYLLLTAGRQDSTMMVEVLEVRRIAASRRAVRILAVVRKRSGAAGPTVAIRLETTETWSFTARLATPDQGIVELQGVPVEEPLGYTWKATLPISAPGRNRVGKLRTPNA